MTGKLGPRRLLEQLRQLAPAGSGTNSRPSVFFSREIGGKPEFYPAAQNRDRFALDKDGKFRAWGIPPGSWDIRLGCWTVEGLGFSGPGSDFIKRVANLRDGETRTVRASLAHLLRGKVRGKIYMNGRPLAGCFLRLNGKKADGKGGETWAGNQGTQVGEDGSFSLQVPPAVYRPVVYLAKGSSRSPAISLPITKSIRVSPGMDLKQDFYLQVSVLHIRVLGMGKRPLVGVKINVSNLARTWSVESPTTAEHGCTTLNQVPAERLQLSITPKPPEYAGSRGAAGVHLLLAYKGRDDD